MNSFDPSNLNSPNAKLSTEDTSSLKTNDNEVLSVLYNSLDNLHTHYSFNVTSYLKEDFGQIEVMEIATEETVELANLASQMVQHSGRIIEWEYTSYSVPVARLYEAVGEWGKLYLLRDGEDYVLALNGTFIGLKVDNG